MIKFIIVLSTVLISNSVYSQGVNFKPINIDKGLEIAKKENKNLFVIMGTTHCGYSQLSFAELYSDTISGKYLNKYFVSIGYGDSTTHNLEKWYYSDTRKQLNIIENELETVLCNYFIFPNYFFFNKNGEIVYINAAPKNPKKILKYAKAVNNGKVKTPFLFRFKFNNRMYPKNKKTYKMLTHCLNAYLFMNLPDSIDYKNDSIYSLKDFIIAKEQINNAKLEIEKSLNYHEYYFNCFLASIIYFRLGNLEKASLYAQKGLNDYPKHWVDSRKLPDMIMKDILKQSS